MLSFLLRKAFSRPAVAANMMHQHSPRTAFELVEVLVHEFLGSLSFGIALYSIAYLPGAEYVGVRVLAIWAVLALWCWDGSSRNFLFDFFLHSRLQALLIGIAQVAGWAYSVHLWYSFLEYVAPGQEPLPLVTPNVSRSAGMHCVGPFCHGPDVSRQTLQEATATFANLLFCLWLVGSPRTQANAETPCTSSASRSRGKKTLLGSSFLARTLDSCAVRLAVPLFGSSVPAEDNVYTTTLISVSASALAEPARSILLNAFAAFTVWWPAVGMNPAQVLGTALASAGHRANCLPAVAGPVAGALAASIVLTLLRSVARPASHPAKIPTRRARSSSKAKRA